MDLNTNHSTYSVILLPSGPHNARHTLHLCAHNSYLLIGIKLMVYSHTREVFTLTRKYAFHEQKTKNQIMNKTTTCIILYNIILKKA